MIIEHLALLYTAGAETIYEKITENKNITESINNRFSKISYLHITYIHMSTCRVITSYGDKITRRPAL